MNLEEDELATVYIALDGYVKNCIRMANRPGLEKEWSEEYLATAKSVADLRDKVKDKLDA